MNNLSQTFVKYHGCGYSYLDGTNMLIETGKKCSLATNEPFWKQPIDTDNKIAKSTRNQVKTKAKASTNHMKRYFKFEKKFQENKYDDASFSSDYSTDDESQNNSLTGMHQKLNKI